MKHGMFFTAAVVMTLLLTLCACGESPAADLPSPTPVADIQADTPEPQPTDAPSDDTGTVVTEDGPVRIATPLYYSPLYIAMEGPFDLEGWFTSAQFLPESPSWYVWEYDGDSVKTCYNYDRFNDLIAHDVYEYDDGGYAVSAEHYSDSGKYICEENSIWSYQFEYTLGTNGRIETIIARKTAYKYDEALTRIVNENTSGVYTIQYTYDENGNMTSLSQSGGTGSEIVSSEFAFSFEYEGNRLVRKVQTYPEFTYVPEYTFEYAGEKLKTAIVDNTLYRTTISMNDAGLVESFTSGKETDEFSYTADGNLSKVAIFYDGSKHSEYIHKLD